MSVGVRGRISPSKVGKRLNHKRKPTAFPPRFLLGIVQIYQAGNKANRVMLSASPQENENTDEATHNKRRKRSRNDEPEALIDTSAAEGDNKRRRRKLSCETCQKRKCRCDFDPVTRTCHRCRTLRLHCSFSDDASLVATAEVYADDGRTGIEERLQKFESSITEIKTALQDVQATLRHGKQSNTRRLETGSKITSSKSSDVEPEDISDPADAGIDRAPALVMRELSKQLTGGSRRLLDHIDLDMVKLGLLDEYTANELLRLFCYHRGQGLLVGDVNHPQLSQHLRNVSPFLHSVCCLNGLAYYSEQLPAVHHAKEIYEKVRLALGQALLASPLPLEEINAVLLLSIYSNNSPSIESQADYIDSWLLTGYCAQQAMLSISFSGIVENVRRGCSTSADRRAIRLWAHICLHHLHWAAATGRPPTIPSPYLNQCNMLLNVYQATVQEGMVVAEILLYLTLNKKLARRSYLDANGECEEFAAWRQKWAHLFAFPRSSSLKLSYHAAYFILAVRSLETMSDEQNAEFPSHEIAEQDVSDPQVDNSGNHESHAVKFAVHLLETYLEMTTRNEIAVYLHMAISFAALVIAQHWQEDSTKVPGRIILDLLSSLEDRGLAYPNMSLTMRYVAELAKRRIRMGLANSSGISALSTLAQDSRGSNTSDGTPLYSAAEGLLGLGNMNSHDGLASSINLGHELPDLGLTSAFPSMEDFFGGGFLDFIR